MMPLIPNSCHPGLAGWKHRKSFLRTHLFAPIPLFLQSQNRLFNSQGRTVVYVGNYRQSQFPKPTHLYHQFLASIFLPWPGCISGVLGRILLTQYLKPGLYSRYQDNFVVQRTSATLSFLLFISLFSALSSTCPRSAAWLQLSSEILDTLHHQAMAIALLYSVEEKSMVDIIYHIVAVNMVRRSWFPDCV